MNYSTIHKEIMDNPYGSLQSLIDSGQCWLMEGHYGRRAMDALESGACILADEPKEDYWGNYIPSYKQVKKGSKGSLENAYKFYQLEEKIKSTKLKNKENN